MCERGGQRGTGTWTTSVLCHGLGRRGQAKRERGGKERKGKRERGMEESSERAAIPFPPPHLGP